MNKLHGLTSNKRGFLAGNLLLVLRERTQLTTQLGVVGYINETSADVPPFTELELLTDSFDREIQLGIYQIFQLKQNYTVQGETLIPGSHLGRVMINTHVFSNEHMGGKLAHVNFRWMDEYSFGDRGQHYDIPFWMFLRAIQEGSLT